MANNSRQVNQLMAYENMASRRPDMSQATPPLRTYNNSENAVVQRVGDPPYKREIRLQTQYVKIALRHDVNASVGADGIDGYKIWSISATGRPPVFQDGEQMKNQGQHKVAWRAIWAVLDLLLDQSLANATTILNQIIQNSAVPIVQEDVVITPVGVEANGHPTKSPQVADELLTLAHIYLCSKQRDNPSWESDDPDQLKGKGEVALKNPLSIWQDEDSSDAEIMSLFSPGPMEVKMSRLLDTTDRSDDEKDEARDRAATELLTHNPAAFAKYKNVILQWLATK
ncbi:MAG: hypothetical protein ABJF11_15270 [Reichenbachiella sp.]|uniref:hypothetical protein n=1 Tax=Reichenbachiella sp. TaxID=2184521 RepID=UPI003264EBDF